VRDGKPKIRAGRVRPAVVEFWRGRQESDLHGKNANTDVCVFFFFSAPGHGTGVVPPPFEPLKDGFVTGRSVATGESKPLLLSFERRKPGGEGEGQYMPPLYRRLSTLIV
jgi:hypothetical protein